MPLEASRGVLWQTKRRRRRGGILNLVYKVRIRKSRTKSESFSLTIVAYENNPAIQKDIKDTIH